MVLYTSGMLMATKLELYVLVMQLLSPQMAHTSFHGGEVLLWFGTLILEQFWLNFIYPSIPSIAVVSPPIADLLLVLLVTRSIFGTLLA